MKDKKEKIVTKNKEKLPKIKKEKAPKIKKERKGKKKAWIIVIVLILLLIAGGYFAYSKFFKVTPPLSIEDFRNEVTSTYDDVISAYGVINIGSVEETLEIENMTSNLKIEEVYFSSGDRISEGDALIRFSEDSVAEACEELEKNLREKDLAYRSGAIEYEQNLITAKYNYDSTILKGEQADEVYNETVASLKSSLESSTKSYNESKDLLAEYKDAQANNTYYTEYKVEYYKQVYDENLEVLKTKMSEWNVGWESVTRSTGRISGNAQEQYQYILSSLYKILETNLSDYEKALENYENDMTDLNYNLLVLELNMSTLEETYQNAQKSYETSLLSAEQTRQTSKTNAELAESEYEANIEKAKTDYDTLKSAYEDALADYETFTSRIVDNEYIAANSGTVMRSSVRNNGSISAGSRIVMYSDYDEITVNVSVDQKDIAKLSVGDTAICYSSSTGILNGTIKSISPITQSSSISSVTYSVTVKIDGSSTSLSSNTTVTVVFGMDMSDVSNFNFNTESQNGFGNEDLFDFSNMFGGSQMPDMSNMPNMGNMPNMDNMPNMGGRP